MSCFPDLIKVRIINTITKQPIKNIALSLKLFAKHKNDYHMVPKISNHDGIIEITKEWIKKEIEIDRNMFIMDYASNLEDCYPKIELKIKDKNSLERTIKARKLYKAPQDEIENLLRAENERFEAISKVVEIKEESILEIEMLTKEV